MYGFQYFLLRTKTFAGLNFQHCKLDWAEFVCTMASSQLHLPPHSAGEQSSHVSLTSKSKWRASRLVQQYLTHRSLCVVEWKIQVKVSISKTVEQWRAVKLSFTHLLLPGEVCHFHHDHTHLLGEHNNVVAIVIPFGHLCVKLAFLLSEALHLLSNFGLLLLGKLCHDGLQKKTKNKRNVTQYLTSRKRFLL